MNKAGRVLCASVITGCLLLFVQGCGKSLQGTSGSKTTEPGMVAQKQPAPTPAPLTLPGEERVSEEIVVAKAEPESVRERVEEMRQEAVATAEAGLEDVFFAFDSWTIADRGKQALAADARWLKAHGDNTLAVEGHCDERGTQAYNLVLGEKRSKAVRNYLVDLGIDAKRLTVTSYGKDRPFCREHSEACYQQNRRGHLVLRAK